MTSLLRSMVVSISMVLFFACMRWLLPRRTESELQESSGKLLPTGVSSGIMCALGLVIALLGFFLLRTLNHGMSLADHDAQMVLYPSAVIWCFLPGFAALLIPWLVTLKMLRRYGYGAEATRIVTKGNNKMNLDGERLMHWMAWVTLVPLAVLTCLALPMRMVITNEQARVTHYARLSPEVFDLRQARSGFLIENDRLRDGSLQPHKSVIFVVPDGRHLDANAMGDGGTSPDVATVVLLLKTTGITLQKALTIDEMR